MHAFSLALALAAAQAPAPASPRLAPVVAPVPVVAPAEGPRVLPTMIAADPAKTAPATPAAAPTPIAAPTATTPSTALSPAPAPPAAKPSSPAAPVPQAAVEKLGQGDRAFLAGEYRNALFAYQDAVYLAPRSAAARVRLGRAYLALRYSAQAIAQGEQALALDPESADARQLLSEAKAAPSGRPGPPKANGAVPLRNGTPDVAPATTAAAAASPAPPAAARNGTGAAAVAATRVYPFAESVPGTGAGATTAAPPSTAAATSPAPPAAPGAAATAASGAPAAATLGVAAAAVAAESARPAAPAAGQGAVNEAPAEFGVARQVGDVRVGGTAMDAQMARIAAPDPAGPTAAQRYRTGLELMTNREFEKAIAELTQAIVLDPRLAVAYAARASARFGIGRYREASDDYKASLAIDENLGTPLYGLAECYRVLGDGKRAAEMYQRYADSKAADVREDLRAIAAKRAQELR